MLKRILPLILLLLLFSACSVSENNSFTLHYFAKNDTDTVCTVSKKSKTPSYEETVQEIYELLCVPQSKNHLSMIPSHIHLKDASVLDGVCTLTLSDKYSELSASEVTTINLCLTKTLCTTGFIEKVIITSNGNSSEFSDNDFLTTAPRTFYDTYTVNLYFANETGDALSSDSVIISPTPDETLEHAVITKLLEGPTSENLRSAIPSGTKLNSIQVSEEGVCIIDLSYEFVKNTSHEPIDEAMALYSIINTITELPMINRVEFLIDGETGNSFVHYDLSKPFTNSSELPQK